MDKPQPSPRSRLAIRAALAAASMALAACQPTEIQAQRPRATVPASEAAAHPGVLARLPDGRRINLRCSGAGAPTILFEGGYGATSLAWDGLRARLSGRYRTCAYDRAGSGFSDPGPEPRDGAAIARDLDRALKAAKIQGPFVVVGHSAGALYMRLFSNRRPREVTGMVLVDPSVEHQDRRFAGMFGPRAASLEPLRARALKCQQAAERRVLPSEEPDLARCVPAPRKDQPDVVNAARRAEALRPSTWAAQVSELDNLWGPTSDAVSMGRQSYGDMPLVVLTAGDGYAELPEPARGAVRQLWSDLHAEIAARSTAGEQRVVAGAGHMLMFDRPDAVIAAIDDVAAGRTKPRPGG